jgi:hypothetical protein
MHIEFLVEDVSGKRALEKLVPKLVGEAHTWDIKSYKGIGNIPPNLNPTTDPRKRILLDQLPRLLRGYGKVFAHDPNQYAVIVVCDLDRHCQQKFRQELLEVLNQCQPKPTTRFCIAVEESEAWLLGDMNAVRKAYPKAKKSVLERYVNDSICGTWELLADAVYPGGVKALKEYGNVGAEKSKWAVNISHHMILEENQSTSFCYFRSKLLELV